MPAPGPRILPLAAAPAVVDALVAAYEAAWAPFYGPDGPGDAGADLRACLDAGDAALPRCLVALAPTGVAVATAQLKAESLGSDRFPGPWLAALLVLPAHRRRGLAAALVAAVEDEARRLGFRGLSTTTDPLITGHLLGARGWRALGEATSLRGPQTVYRKELAPPPADG